VWPRIEETWTTPRSVYEFVGCIVTRSGIACEYKREGILLFDPDILPAQAPELVTLPQDSTTVFNNADDFDGDVL
jgi:hypothetical protein